MTPKLSVLSNWKDRDAITGMGKILVRAGFGGMVRLWFEPFQFDTCFGHPSGNIRGELGI